MIAEVPRAVIDSSIVAGSIVAVIAAGAAVGKLRPVRWVWRRLVSGPFSGMLARTITGEVRPMIDEVKAASKAQHDEQNIIIAGIGQRLDSGSQVFADHAARLTAIEQRHITITTHTVTTDEPNDTPKDAA